MRRLHLIVALVLWAAAGTSAWGESASFELPIVAPETLGLDGQHLERIDQLVADEIEQGNLPGCVVLVGRRGAVGFARAYGHRQLEPAPEVMTLDTVFDMASLTKPIATATSIMILVERGKVRLRDPVERYIPEFAQNGKVEITVEHLLTHQAGLIPDNPLSDYQDGPAEAWNRIWALKPKAAIGEKFIYTDVGFLVLGEIVRRTSGRDVARFARENIFQPLGMTETGFLPPPQLRQRAAPTEQRDGRWLRGEVHDPRAALLEGVAGHAGLFSTAGDLALYAHMMLQRGTVAEVRILSPQTVAEMTRSRDVAGRLRGLGWDMRSRYSSNRGEIYSPRAFGHGGFTGTAMWIDPELNLFVVFLSNRLHPDGEGSVNHLAGRVGTVAAAAITRDSQQATLENGTPSPYPLPRRRGRGFSDGFLTTQSPVLLGVDVLERDAFRALQNRRVGLITNHTGLNRHAVRTIDLLHQAPQVELVSIFSPEHGLQGTLDVSEITDSRDQATNLPVHSLYGETRQPQPEDLQEIDTLVFDIQDIGTRFYTYITTMRLAMEAAAQHGLRFVVLDRPNPIGGKLVEGPVLDAGKESFVGFHPVCVRHGMTAGELARMFREERGLDLDLQVVELENWRREDYWDRTGLVWTNPSPNMRSLTQAVVYPGIGLLETTNLSVGRGTDTPFEVIGAPWMDGQKLAQQLNQARLGGVRFVPIRFTPDASKFANEPCSGVNLVVVDRAKFFPVEVGLHVACTLRRLYPQQWDMARFNRLLANQAVYDAIASGAGPEELLPLYRPKHLQFLERRRAFLIYPANGE